jgi:energy-coupling factor transporter ATP-binding protein EcfA2
VKLLRRDAALESVVDRMAALQRFCSIASPYLPSSLLAPASALVDRAGERLSLSRTHTVAALAGSTGSGKSSLFNALAGVSLSPAGLRRPTTGEAYACVWGTDEAGPLLDWLKVGHRFGVSSTPALDGLVLLDLPDFDSVEASHHVEVDRLLSVVDLIVWVLHPQKYADKVVHRQYLAQFARHSSVTVVVLNAADLLSPPDLAECITDLSSLLADDGLAGVPVLTTSTVGPPGVSALSTALGSAVAARQAALQRLGADLDGVVASLDQYVAPSPSAIDGRKWGLVDAFSRAAGVPVVASAVEGAYVHRARRVTGWPPARWVRRFRPDPLSRLRLGTSTAASTDEHVGATSIGPAAPAAQAAVGLAVREVAARGSADLPPVWQEAVLSAARSNLDNVPDALDVAVAQTDLGVPRKRFWWQAVGVLQWIGTLALIAGLLWLIVRYALFALALPEPPMPDVGRLPLPTALLFGGLLFGLILSLLARPVVRLAARRQRRRATARLRTRVEQVAQDLVIAPVQAVMTAYRDARDALRRAA